MTSPDPKAGPLCFGSPQEWRHWLETHAGTASEVLVGFHKRTTDRPSLTWPQSVEEALCFGWIDGVRRRVDDETYTIRFTPRRKASIWSRINVAKVQQLTAQGRMRPAGMAVYEGRRHEKTGLYAFERERPAELAPAEVREFKRHRLAWKYFESSAPSYRKVITHWVVSAKRPATRARRLEQLIQACAEQRRILG